MYTQMKSHAPTTTKTDTLSYDVVTDMRRRDPPALDLRAPLLLHTKMNVWCHRRPAVEDWTVGDLRPDAVLYVNGERLIYLNIHICYIYMRIVRCVHDKPEQL